MISGAQIQKAVPYITWSILFMNENFINDRTEFCVVISRAYRGIGLNRFDKVVKVHVSLIRNFSKGGNTCIPRNHGFVRWPMRCRRRVRIFGKICNCSLEALRELYFCRGGRRSVECSEKNRHYIMVKVIIVEKLVIMIYGTWMTYILSRATPPGWGRAANWGMLHLHT